MSIRQEATIRRLEIFGLSTPDSIRLTKHINNLISCNGPEWTIARLKQIKVGFIQHLAGKTTKFEWIKTKNGLPSGTFQPIFKLKNPQKVLSCLMVYSSLVSSSVTSKQWDKFSKSVSKVRTNDFLIMNQLGIDGYSDKGIGLLHQFAPNLNDLASDKTIRMYMSKKRVPNYKSPTYKTVDGNAMYAMDSFGHGKARKFISTQYSGLPEWIVKEFSQRWSTIRDVEYALDRYDYVGRISFIQEPGYKLRAIANPLSCFQVLLEPLKKSLMDLLLKIPNDFTHDQDAGCLYLQQLVKSHTMSSIDLSDATNNLPLEDQINMLTLLFGESHPLIRLFEDVSTSKWIVDGPNGEQFLKWNTGQPLGLGPSFPSFALYHHFIVRYAMVLGGETEAVNDLLLSLRGQQPSKEYNYAIVGDDIVMESQYQGYYMNLMSLLECKISADKCIFESSTAEFCSRIITSTHIYRQYKWTPVSDKSFIDFCKAHGPRSIALLKPRQRFVVNHLSKIPYTLGGPLSWNPEGKPLGIRENEWWEVAEQLFQKSETTNSVPRDRLHYEFKKELQLIKFNHDTLLKNVVHHGIREISTVDDTSRSIRSVVDIIVRQHKDHGTEYFSERVSRNLMQYMLEEEINFVDAQLTEEERKAINWLIDFTQQDKKVQSDYSPYLNKLFNFFKK